MSHEIVRILSRPVGDEVNSVDARELHQALGVGEHFSTWIRKRIDELGLVLGIDLEGFSESPRNPLGGRPSFEYVVTLDAAKHLAMVERNDRGREIRAYFIEAEKRMRSPEAAAMAALSDPAALRGLLGSYAERVIALEATVAEQAPKVQVYDRVIDVDDTSGFREAAQAIRAATGANENEVRGLMRAQGWVQRLDGKLAPTAPGIDRGFVTRRMRPHTRPDGSQHTTVELRITPKGITKAIELILAKEHVA